MSEAAAITLDRHAGARRSCRSGEGTRGLVGTFWSLKQWAHSDSSFCGCLANGGQPAHQCPHVTNGAVISVKNCTIFSQVILFQLGCVYYSKAWQVRALCLQQYWWIVKQHQINRTRTCLDLFIHKIVRQNYANRDLTLLEKLNYRNTVTEWAEFFYFAMEIMVLIDWN